MPLQALTYSDPPQPTAQQPCGREEFKAMVSMNTTGVPQSIGKYYVLRELGRGATSTVYLAEDPFNARKVAVKQIHAHLLVDEDLGRRYRRGLRNEAVLAGQLRHPYIVNVLDADGEANPPYLVLEGSPLSKFTKPDRLLPVEQVLDICFKCCSALEYAQVRGLVHRDIKPANLILDAKGNIKLMDFGTALASHGETTHMTGLVGSPVYMAPEQVREERCTYRSDMFSLGVVMFELLTGRKPLEGDTDYATLYKIGYEQPPAPSVLRPGLPKPLDDILLRAMAKNPEQRFELWDDFADAVVTVSRGIPKRDTRHQEGEAFTRMRQLPFFSGFPDAALWETLRLGTLNSCSAGTALVEEGAAGNSFFLLLEGRVCVLRGGWQVATIEPGVSIGEMAYLSREQQKRTAAAVAETDVLTLEIKSEALQRASDDVQMCFDKAFIDLLLKRLIATTDELSRQNAGGQMLAS
jgi:eukaryotic-like serine/threonine-protein kinase